MNAKEGLTRRLTPRDAAVPARLLVMEGPGRGRKHLIPDVAVIGRSMKADIVIDDPALSRSHARIIRTPEGYVLEDLQSRNGTFVKGIPVQSHTLSFGDAIQVGTNVSLLFTRYDLAEDQVMQRQRLETLGRLGAGIAHDFNNMQGVVLASLDYLRRIGSERTLGDKEVQECLADIDAASARATELASHLLSFARIDKQGYVPVHLSKVCREIVHMARRTFGQTIRIDQEIEPELYVMGSSGELQQLLMNLAVNSRDAMAGGGELVVRVARASPKVLLAVELPDNSAHLEMSVRDTGVGMDEHTLQRVFEAFFTTKREGAGFGLGLATAQDIVRLHGGRLTITSEVGKGTTVTVVLPQHIPQTESPKKRADTINLGAQRARQGEVVLLVDDEDMVRKSMGRVLAHAGYEVIQAADGSEAVGVYASRPQRPHIVLLDLDMPNMGGIEALDILMELDRNVRVLLMSGHFDALQQNALRSKGALGFLRKPCSATVLLSDVSKAIERSAVELDETPTLRRTAPSGYNFAPDDGPR